MLGFNKALSCPAVMIGKQELMLSIYYPIIQKVGKSESHAVYENEPSVL